MKSSATVSKKTSITNPLLRISTAGSVDDGKSTLIGRLFLDSKALMEDQLESLKQDTGNSHHFDLAALTDGLRSEREQGITIDVAYRFFSTPKRAFILADTPGHVQYTRNMATGASTADCAIILIDAAKGMTTQTRRHAYLSHLLGIRFLAVAINKMDLVKYNEERFDVIRLQFKKLINSLGGIQAAFFPVSALNGDNIVNLSGKMPWYRGATLLQYLETLRPQNQKTVPLRFPVQYVLRPNAHFRGFAGQIASGNLNKGDRVKVLPSNIETTIKTVLTYDGELDSAQSGRSVTVTLENEVDLSRGDMLVSPDQSPHIASQFRANIVWMSENPLDIHKTYLIKHTTQLTKCRISKLVHQIDVETYRKIPPKTLGLNDIAECELSVYRNLYIDLYKNSRATGNFIILDPDSNETVAAGMVTKFGNVTKKRSAGRAKEPWSRSLMKALTWRILATLTTALAVLFVTKEPVIALGVGGIEIVAKICLYLVHERLWHCIPLGERGEFQAGGGI